jgi:hypothetical protein
MSKRAELSEGKRPRQLEQYGVNSPLSVLNSFSLQGVAHFAQRRGGLFFAAGAGAAVGSAMGIR